MNITNPWLNPYQRSYHQIKQQLITGLTSITDRNGNQLITDVSEGNILIILLSMFAAIAEVLHYYIDTKAREFFLGTARRYTSVQALGNLVGYYPKAAIAATVDLVLTRGDKASSGSNISGTIAEGSTFTQGDLTWAVVNKIVIPPYTSQVRVPVIQHRFYNLESLVGMSIQAGDNSIILSSSELPSGELYEHGSMDLFVGGEHYTLVETFAYSRPDDKHFRVIVDASGNLVIIFGDGKFGAAPVGDVITEASCYLTKGTIGNVDAGAITYTLMEGMDTTNPYPATGGSDYEDIESMRSRIPLQARTQGVAITKRDYEDLALMVPGVGKAKVEMVCGRRVSLYIYPSNASVNSDLQASNILKHQVWTKLNKYLPITTILKVYSLGTSDIVLDVDITGRANYKAQDILTHVRTALYTAYNAQASNIGGTVRISDLYALMDNLPSIDFLRINKFYVRPYIIPLNYGIGFSPQAFNLTKADQSVTYIITMLANNMASVVSTDGRVEVSSIPTTTSTGITDMVHGVAFSMTLLTGAQAATIGRPGNKFKVTVSQINSDYVDTGYTVPIFARDTDLTTKITETI
jgi:uncharacterized phage protein gp47/JayE